MKNVEPVIFGVLLTVTLGALWQGQGDETSFADTGADITVFAPPKSVGISALQWVGPHNSARLDLQGEGEDAVPWITWNSKSKPDTTTEEGDVLVGRPAIERQFPGSREANKILSFFQPLMAERRFDDLSTEALDEMGLKEPKEELVIFAEDAAHYYHLGGSAYGSDHLYLQEKDGGPVFLVASQGIRPLRRATNRLMERDPFPGDVAEVVTAEIRLGTGVIVEAKHQNRGDATSAFWALASSPERQDGRLHSFFEGLAKVRVDEYPLESEKPLEITPSLSVVFRNETGKIWGEGGIGRLEGQNNLYVKSALTRRWVPLTEKGSAELSEQLEDLKDF